MGEREVKGKIFKKEKARKREIVDCLVLGKCQNQLQKGLWQDIEKIIRQLGRITRFYEKKTWSMDLEYIQDVINGEYK